MYDNKEADSLDGRFQENAWQLADNMADALLYNGLKWYTSTHKMESFPFVSFYLGGNLPSAIIILG